MFGYRGGAESFGDLVGFPRTGTRVVWIRDASGERQRGYYPSQVGRVRRRNDPAFAGHPGSGFLRAVRYP